jgi:hypothetical protein
MRRAIFIVIAGLAITACGDNNGTPKDAAPDTPADGGVDGSSGAIGPCLDRPTDLPRAPSGALPCDLISPGFTQ